MPLQDIEILIRDKVGKTDNKVFDAVLGQVLTMIRQSGNGRDMESLLKALTYIGSMPTVAKAFLSSPKVVPLIAKLEQQKEIDAVFDRDLLIKMRASTANVFKPPKEPLSSEEQKILKEIYIAVRREYKKPAWSYSYSSEVFDEVLNSGWDVEKDQALRDFGRDTKIEGISGQNEADIYPGLGEKEREGRAISRISELVAKAGGYKDLAGSKEGLERWLRNNGGQAPILGLLTHLFFEKPNFSKDPLAYQKVGSETNWVIENGKVVLNYDVVVPVVRSAEGFLAATKDGIKYVKMDDNEKIESAFNQIEQLKAANQSLPKLMQFKGKMVLEVDGKGKVVPKMMSCKVTSYSNQLTSPAHLYLSPDKDKENTPTPGLK